MPGFQEQGRNLVPQEPTRELSPFEGKSLTRATERTRRPEGFLVPLAPDQREGILGTVTFARQALDDVNNLLGTTEGENWRLLTGVQIADAYDSILSAQESGALLAPAAAAELTRRQSMMSARVGTLMDLHADNEQWVLGIQQGATQGLSNQLRTISSFLNEGYLSTEVAQAVPEQTVQAVNRQNEENFRRAFSDLVGFCIPDRQTVDYSPTDASASVLQEGIIDAFRYSPPFAVELIKKWYSVMLNNSTTNTMEVAFARSTAFLLKEMPQTELSDELSHQVAGIVTGSGGLFKRMEDPSVFEICADELLPDFVTDKTVDLLTQAGSRELVHIDDEIRDIELSQFTREARFPYWSLLRKQQRMLFGLMRLGLVRGEAQASLLYNAFINSVGKEQKMASFNPEMNGKLYLSQEETRAVREEFWDQATGPLPVQREEILNIAARRVSASLTTEELDKFNTLRTNI